MASMALSVGAVAQEAQPLSLPDAVKMTLANNPLHRAALADTKGAAAGVREARAPRKYKNNDASVPCKSLNKDTSTLSYCGA